MARKRRQWISQTAGSFHIISRTTGGDILLHDQEKEYFLELLECFAAGYFVAIHSFAILGNHFHIQATGLNLEAEKATPDELLRRYHLMFGDHQEPPTGSSSSGAFIPDEDDGIQRLRNRLGSISRFVQELKQTFTKWYNQKQNRKGYLWSDRFKGVIVDKGEAQLTVNAYVDLNPVRAGLVESPEDYRWCSLGMQVRNPERAAKLLTWTSDIPSEIPPDIAETTNEEKGLYKQREPLFSFFRKESWATKLAWYREFVYIAGGIEKEGKHSIPRELVDEVRKCHGKLGIGNRFRYRVKNISEGWAIGSHRFISSIQKKHNRKFIKPRPFLLLKNNSDSLFATRVLRS